MKRILCFLLVLLLLSASLPVFAAEEKEYRFDFENERPDAPLPAGDLTVSGFSHQVVGGVDTHGTVLYLASRSGAGDTSVTLRNGYADKTLTFEFLCSGDFGKDGGLRAKVCKRGKDEVSVLLSPAAPLRLSDTSSGGSTLGESKTSPDKVNVWYTARICFSDSVVCARVWQSGKEEPAGWDAVGLSMLSFSDSGSSVELSMAGCGAGTGNVYLDNLRVSPLTDEERAALPKVSKPFTVTVKSADTKMGTAKGGGLYQAGSTATVSAEPKNGFVFVNWTDKTGKEVSKDMNHRFEVGADVSLTANFAPMPTAIRSFMAEGLTTAAEIDSEKKTISLRFASDADLKNVYPYFYVEGSGEPEQRSFERMDLSSGKAVIGTGDGQWTVTAVQNTVMKTFFVDGKNGSDENGGLSADSAFATLEKAKAAVASVEDWSGDVVVSIAPGEYRIDRTLRFTAEDSAPRGYAVIWQGASEDPNDVVLTGGFRLGGKWEESLDVDVEKGLTAWEYDAKGLPFSRDLYVGGEPAQIARLVLDDNTAGNWEMADVPDLALDTSFGYLASGKLSDMHEWKNVSDLEFAYEVGWTYSIVPVENVVEKGSGSKVMMKKSAFQAALNKGGVQIKDPNFILFCFEGLDEKGEWYYDREEEKIYYITREGDDPNEMEIVLPTTDRLISVSGEDERRVYGFTLKNLRFEYTSYLRPHTYGQAEIQASYIQNVDALNWKYFHQHDSYLKTDGGITVAYAEGARVSHCVFTSMAASAFDFEIGCVGCQFVRNTIKNVGANGISVGGVSVRDAQPFAAKAYVNGVLENVKPDPGRVTQYTLVFSNRLDGIGLLYKGSVGISVGHVADVTVAHNTIVNASYSGVSIGWGWGAWDGNGNTPESSYYNFPDTASVQARYVVMNNDISKVCQRLADGGTVYALSLMPGSRLIGNLMHDSPIKFGGVYFDTATGGFDRIEGNILYSVYQNFFYHTTSDYYNGRDAEMTALMNSGKNYLGVTPAKGAKDPAYQAIVENAGVMDEALPPEVRLPGEHVHAFGEWVTVTEPTTQPGLEKRTCACGEEETREIPVPLPETEAGGKDGKTALLIGGAAAAAAAIVGAAVGIAVKKKKKK